MAYLVVTFDEDKSVSEISSNWLETTDDKVTSCWWPTGCKNISSLIAKRAEPDKQTWQLLRITVEKWCQTLDKARKIASDKYYKTTDDEELGKGRRCVRKRVIPSSSDEESENNEPPKLSRTKPPPKIRSILTDLPLCPNDTAPSLESTHSKNGEESARTSSQSPKNIVEPNHLDIGFTEKLDQNGGKTGSLSGAQTGLIRKVPEPAAPNVTNISKAANEALNGVQPQEDCTMQEYLKIIIRMIAAMQVQIREIRQQLDRGYKPGASGEIDLVKSQLPLKSLAEIVSFEDQICNNAEVATQFGTFVRKIGGRTAREDVQRIYRKTFTNECAQLCSWKGRKENFRIEGLHLTIIIKDAILEGYPATKEIEFEETVSEWFRFARQRANRESEKARKRKEPILS